MAAAYSVDIDLGEVLEQTNDMTEQVGSLRKAFDALGKDGGDAVKMLGSKVGEAFEKMLSIIKPARLLIWLFDTLSKMDPFRMLGKAYENIMKIYDKLKDMSAGSTERAQDARGARTTAKNMRLFEQSFKIMGWDRNVLKDITNAVDGGALDSLAAAGVDTERIKKLDGVEQLFAIYEGVEKYAKNMGGYDAVAIKPIMELMEKISPIFSAQNMRGNQGIFEERKAYYRELQAKDKGDDAAMSEFEKAYGKLADSFNNLWNLIAAKLLPIFTRLTNWLKELVDSVVEFLANNPLKVISEWIVNLFSEIAKYLGLDKISKMGSVAVDLVKKVDDATGMSSARNLVKKGASFVRSHVDKTLGISAENDKKKAFTQKGLDSIADAKAKYGKAYNIDKNMEARIMQFYRAATKDLTHAEKMRVDLNFSVDSRGNLVLDITDGSGANRALMRQQVIGRASK